MNHIQEYISKQQRAFEDQFPALDDSAALCSKDELESFLTYALIGLLETVTF